MADKPNTETQTAQTQPQKQKDTSAGIVLYRRAGTGECDLEILLAHPGGPFWRNKDTHGWSVPKGIVEAGENLADAARREFAEEVGAPPPPGDLVALPTIDIGKKYLSLFVLEGDLNVTNFGSSEMRANTFEMEWPPKSGEFVEFPEVDRLQWFSLLDAETKLHKSQVPIVSLVHSALCA